MRRRAAAARPQRDDAECKVKRAVTVGNRFASFAGAICSEENNAEPENQKHDCEGFFHCCVILTRIESQFVRSLARLGSRVLCWHAYPGLRPWATVVTRRWRWSQAKSQHKLPRALAPRAHSACSGWQINRDYVRIVILKLCCTRFWCRPLQGSTDFLILTQGLRPGLLLWRAVSAFRNVLDSAFYR
jgi:hypothetical protein